VSAWRSVRKCLCKVEVEVEARVKAMVVSKELGSAVGLDGLDGSCEGRC